MPTPPRARPPLQRRLGLPSAIAIGLASMLGAGVFAVWGPAALAAGSGPGLLAALTLAGGIAYCNARSTARLAARYPQAGGAYVYGTRRINPAVGFTAGWAFLVGKTASAAAMALTLGAYLLPDHPRAIAAAAVVALCAINLLGVKKTALASAVFAASTLAVLAAVVVAGLTGPVAAQPLGDTHFWGILTAAGFIFFAFAGYARVATLGEEVTDPERTIPRAIPIALGITFAVYLLVAVTALIVLGPGMLAASTAPLSDLAGAGAPALKPLVAVGAGVAVAGVLLSLLAGIGRTSLAMARDRRLPGGLAAVSERFGVPWAAELAASALVLVLVSTLDLRGAIGFSSFCVLIYYAVANASAVTLDRRAPIPWLGLAGCLLVAVSLPWAAVLGGLAVFAVGAAWYAVTERRAAESH
ncbi:APC family permease [Glycomyces sp. TRM65418]|uniref:APC family permease n=1 Tax=Glycomyces sp. TRM65418 TaxID=2867006 RepID=UPI001CE571CB|nr:APC family permease [Glycomyces sp. TRM65418]MCC3762765.1 APC family permease [Glycomyces sp. TRM65418]QZD56796.1 APC family permease [Glycomyces sp. TRM65418]